MKIQNSFSIISAEKYISKYSKQTLEFHIYNETNLNHIRFIFSEKIGTRVRFEVFSFGPVINFWFPTPLGIGLNVVVKGGGG